MPLRPSRAPWGSSPRSLRLLTLLVQRPRTHPCEPPIGRSRPDEFRLMMGPLRVRVKSFNRDFGLPPRSPRLQDASPRPPLLVFVVSVRASTASPRSPRGARAYRPFRTPGSFPPRRGSTEGRCQDEQDPSPVGCANVLSPATGERVLKTAGAPSVAFGDVSPVGDGGEGPLGTGERA